MDREWHQVNTVWAKGPTTDETPGRECETTPEAVVGERFDGILRAAGVEATG
jgi:hypothetical protein